MTPKQRAGSMRPVTVLHPPPEVDAGAVQGLFMGSRYWVWVGQPGAWSWRVQWGGDVSPAYRATAPVCRGTEDTQRNARAAAYQAIRTAANYHPRTMEEADDE